MIKRSSESSIISSNENQTENGRIKNEMRAGRISSSSLSLFFFSFALFCFGGCFFSFFSITFSVCNQSVDVDASLEDECVIENGERKRTNQ